jgi:hypothetical protein
MSRSAPVEVLVSRLLQTFYHPEAKLTRVARVSAPVPDE